VRLDLNRFQIGAQQIGSAVRSLFFIFRERPKSLDWRGFPKLGRAKS
jgi:hypothetical protein